MFFSFSFFLFSFFFLSLFFFFLFFLYFYLYCGKGRGVCFLSFAFIGGIYLSFSFLAGGAFIGREADLEPQWAIGLRIGQLVSG